MLLAVPQHLEMAIIIILNNPAQPLFMHFFPQKITLWGGEVLALALNLGVFGVGLHPDGPGCPETP